MRKFLWIAVAAAAIALPVSAWSQQPDQKTDTKVDPKQEQQEVHGAQGPQSAASAGADSQDQGKGATPQTITVSSDSTQAPAPQQDALAAAARKAREQKKESAKAGKVFTNDNIPTSGGISSLGSASATAPKDDDTTSSAPTSKDEKTWRDRFAQLRHKLAEDKQDLDVMQRELGVLDVQYYNDPVKAMQQQLTRSDINDKTAKIDAMKKQIDADQQAIDDAEDDLRKSGGDPGWAR
jgi:hypothetical protein